MALPQSAYWDESQSWVHPLQPIFPPDSDGSSFESLNAQSWKRRAPRASLACDQCREKKKACDEGRPCASCERANITCRYSSSKSTRRVVDVEESIHRLAQYNAKLSADIKSLDGYRPVVDALTARFEALEKRVAQGVPVGACPTMRREIWNSRRQCHFSGAHNLINLWPTVHGVLYTAGIPIDPAYVSIAEDKAAWYLKQGQNDFIKTHHVLSPHFADADARRDDGIHNTNKRKATELSNQFGDIESFVGNVQRTSRHRLLLQSYVEHMHLLHPIVDLNYVESLFDQQSGDGADKLESSADGDMSEGMSPDRVNKRRRVGSLESARKYYRPNDSNSAALNTALVLLILALGEVCAYKRRSVPQRRDSTSTEGTASNSSSFSSNTISPADTSITQPSPRMLKSTGNSPMLANIEHARLSSPRTAPRSVESTFPGMRYFERATQIMGPHMGGNELVHAQIAILAGLYKGQIGQVRESMNWICTAGRTVQFLLHRYGFLAEERDSSFPEDPIKMRTQMQQRMKGPEDHLIVLAAWTCIQLESDILAELPFPPSGILAYEHELPWPSRIPGAELYSKLLPPDATRASNFSSHKVLMVYTAQLWLRKRLNSIQDQLHGHASSVLQPDQLHHVLLEHQEHLYGWRTTLPTELTWDNDEIPAQGILHARLRAKYWGACFLAYRPYLDYILHAMPEVGEADERHIVALDSYGQPRSDAATRFFEPIATMSEAEVLEGVTKCIEAAFQSTHAFDGISHELIVTNLHGTAHAQFGNVLVLVAAYTNPLLRPMITHGRLMDLIKHTIGFLDRTHFLPHTCKIDRAILKKLLLALAENP